MATYQITAPSGKRYKITGPPNASREDLIRQIKAQEHRDSQIGGDDYEYQSEDTNFLEDVADVGVGVASGLYRAAGSVVGLGSYVKGLNELADPIASWLHRAGDTIDEGLLSARQKELNREISTRLQNVITTLPEEAELGDYYDAMLEGGGEAGDFLWNHKAQVFNLIAQSVPYMLGGGAITKGLNFGLKKFGAKPLGQIVGAGVGEGMIVGGDLVTQHIAETDSVGEYDADRLKLLGAIPTTAVIAMAGGRIAKGLKVADPDVAITGKIAYGTDLLSNTHMAGGLVRRTALGAAIESGEEFLQEGTEQMWGNIAAGRHPLVGVGGPAVMGAAAGGGQSGGLNLLGAAADIRSKKSKHVLDKDRAEVDDKYKDLEKQVEQAEQEKLVEVTEQQDLFNSNEDILKNVLNLVGIDNLNIAENIAGVDPEVVNNLESPLDQALYYLQKLKEAPYQTFESDDGRSKTNSENLIKSFEKHIESMAPGHLAAEEEADLIQTENESRRKHAGTYPNEREWEKIVASEEFERLRIEISDRNTELGKLFTEWQDATDIDIKYMHDTDANGLPTEGAIKLFIKDHPDLFPKGAIGSYVEALTEHAKLEEDRLTRNEGVNELIVEEIAKLVARRTQALADGDLQELRTIEGEVAQRQSPVFSAEWLEAKRAIAVVKPKKTTDAAEKVIIPGEAPVTTTIVGQVDDAVDDTSEQGQLNLGEQGQLNLGEQEEANSKLLRYKEGSQRQANHEKAVTEFGENYENEWFGPKVVAAIKKGGEKSFANFVEHQRFKEMQWKMANALEDSELRALNQIPLKGTWQQAVVPFLVDAANRDRIEDYGTYQSKLSKTPDPAEIKKRVRGVDYELDHKSLTEAEKKKLNFVSKAKKPSTLSDIIESINKKRKVEKRPLLEPKTKFTINELKKPEEKTEEGEEQEGHNFTFFNQIIAAELKELGITGTEELTERDAGKRINDALVAYRKNQIKFGESEQAEKALYDKLAPKGKDTAALRKENKRRKVAGDPPLVSRKFRELIETFFERTQEKVDLERSSSTATVSQLEPDTGLKKSPTQVEDEGVALKGEIDAADELTRLKSAGASQAKIDALTAEEKEYVAEKANKADPEYLKRVAVLKKASIERVKKVNSNKKFLKELKTEWTKQNKGDASKGETVYLPYDQQSIEVQEAWIWSVNKANSQRDRRPFLLAREFKDTVQSHRDTIKKIGDEKYEETDSIPEIEISELAEEKRKARERESRPGTPYYKKSAADIEQALSKELKKVGRKKLTDRQRANAIKKLKARPIVKRENGKYVNIPLALRRHIDSIEDGRALWEYSTSELVLQAKIAIVNMEQDTLDPKTWKKLKGSDLNKFNSLKDFINKWQEKKGGDAPDDSDFRLNVTDIHAVDEFLETLQATPADMEAMFHKLIGRKFYKKLYDQGKISYYKTAAEAVKGVNKDRSNKVEEGRFDDSGAFVETNADGTLSRIAFILGHIRKEDAASVFMHEVGGHIGLEGVLGPKGAAVLAREIRGWARGIPPVGSTAYKRTSMSKEKLAAQANERVERHKRAAIRHGKPLTQEDIDNETLAYFVQGAFNAGVKPTDVTAAGKILKRFRDAFLKFMQLARLSKQGNYKSSEKPNITAQNIVDMAWGGAKLELRPSLGYIWKTFRSGSRYLGTTTARNLIEKAYREDLVAPVRFKAVKHDPIGMEDPVDPRSKKRRKMAEELRKLQAVKPSNMTQAKLERKLQLEDEFRFMNYLWERHKVAEGSRAKIDALNKEIRALDAKKREHRASSKKTFSEMTTETELERMEQVLSAQEKNKKSQLDAGVISKEEYDLSIKDINYKRENPDLFEDNGIYYHGTSKPIERLDYAPGSFNIYGAGLYTTMDKGVAYKYTKKGKGKKPTLYRVIEKHPGPSLNIETTPAIQFGKGILSEFFTDKELKSMSLREAIDEFRARSTDEMYPAHEVIDLIANIFDNAYDKGYKSITHYGGRLSGGTKHRVKIFTHPADDVELEENSIFWDKKIEDKIRRELPKNDKGKYITEGGAYLAREDWIKFQISQGREEKRLRLVLEAHVADLMKDAAQHERDMGGPDGTIQDSIKRPNLNEEEKKRSKDEADRIEKHVGKHFNAEMKGMWTTMKDLATKGGRKLEFLHDQIYRNRKEMPAGVTFGGNLLDAEGLRNELKQTAEAVAIQARNLNPARTYLVNKTIAYGTINDVWPADPNTENVSVEKGNVTIDKNFQKLFEKELTESEQNIVMDVYRHGIHLLEEYRIHLEATVGKDAAKGVLKLLATNGPYAHLARTGNHTVTLKSNKFVKAQQKLEKGSTSKERLKKIEAEYTKLKGDTNHYIYTHFLTEGEAEKFMDAEEKTGNWAPFDDSVEVKERGMRYQEKPPAIGAGRESDIKVIEKVYGALATSGLEPDTQKMVEGLLERLFLNSLEETNARQSMARREGIGGYDENMLRSFVSNAKSQANLIANLAYGKAINVSLSEAWKESKEHPNDRTSKLYKELVFHYNLMLSGTDTNIQDSIASFTTAWMLTLNPSYHLQNMTQPWAVSYPILAATFNDWKGVAPRLAEGYAIAQSIISYDGKVPFLSLKKVTWQTNVDVENVPAWVSPTDKKGKLKISEEERERRLKMWVETIKPLLVGLKRGNILDLGLEADLSDNVNMKVTGFVPYDAASKFAGQASHRLFQVPRMVEAYNRIATAVAAHEMAVANPKVMALLETTPHEFAVHIVRRTQGDFTASGAPSAIKWLIQVPGIGKLIAQFQKFRFLMIANVVYAYQDAFKGATPIEKEIGRRALTYLLAHTTVLGGFKAIPLIGGGVGGVSLIHVYFWLMSAVGARDDDDEEILTEGLLERKIMESFPDNPEFAKAIARGLPYLIGVDTSTKLSHAGIFDPTPFTEWELSQEGFKDLGFTIFGAAGSNALNMARGAEFMWEGNYYRGIESMMPKGPRNLMESYRLATEGYSVGDRIAATPDNFSSKALMLNALGLSTKDIGGLKWTRSEHFQIENYFSKAQDVLYKKYNDARKNGNKKRMAEIKAEFLTLQNRKDGLRPFFNNARSAIPRTPVSSLYLAPLRQIKAETEYRQELNTM